MNPKYRDEYTQLRIQIRALAIALATAMAEEHNDRITDIRRQQRKAEDRVQEILRDES